MMNSKPSEDPNAGDVPNQPQVWTNSLILFERSRPDQAKSRTGVEKKHPLSNTYGRVGFATYILPPLFVEQKIR